MTQPPPTDDLSFCLALADGDEQAARVFERRYRPAVRHAFGTALRRWRPDRPVETDDFVQDFISFLFSDSGRRLRTFAGRSAFGSWLYTVALRYFQRQLSRMRNDRRAPPVLAELQPSLDASPEHSAVASQQAQRLREAVHLLSENDQLYARLFFVEGLNATEVARTLGKGKSAIRMQKMRMLERLRALLSEPESDTPPTAQGAQAPQARGTGR